MILTDIIILCSFYVRFYSLFATDVAPTDVAHRSAEETAGGARQHSKTAAAELSV